MQINLGGLGLTGINAGVTAGNKVTMADWLGVGTGQLEIYNQANYGYTGLDGDISLQFAVTGSGDTSPRNFAANATIDSSATWTGSAYRTMFEYTDASSVSPAFGAGSYMGFRMGSSTSYNYGWLETTWDPTTKQFEILSGAYESVAGVAIAAGDTGGGGVSAIPETSSVLGLAGLVAGSAFLRRRKAA